MAREIYVQREQWPDRVAIWGGPGSDAWKQDLLRRYREAPVSREEYEQGDQLRNRMPITPSGPPGPPTMELWPQEDESPNDVFRKLAPPDQKESSPLEEDMDVDDFLRLVSRRKRM